jgi:hypothetical protein
MQLSISTNFPAIQTALNALHEGVRTKALASAMNKTIALAKTQMIREVTGTYRVTSSYVRERLAVRRATFRGGQFGVSAELSATRKGRSGANLIAFVSKVDAMRGGVKRRKNGTRGQLKFQIKKAGGKRVIKGAFIGNSGRTVFVRTTDKRLPIKALTTIDVVQMFNQRKINARVVGMINSRFPTIFANEVRFFTERFNRG